jgi:ABC-type antimicrobial peptide transport system permease subunit
LVPDVIMPLEARLLTALARPRLYAVLLGGFGGAALAIAAVGLFALFSYVVAQRSREFAVRTALGATRRDILRLAVAQGLAAIVAGLLAGMVCSAWLTRLLSAQLYGVTPYDTATFVSVPLVLLLCGALAACVPALRAARLDPMRVLRGSSL